jgi:hypothetical protein
MIRMIRNVGQGGKVALIPGSISEYFPYHCVIWRLRDEAAPSVLAEWMPWQNAY